MVVHSNVAILTSSLKINKSKKKTLIRNGEGFGFYIDGLTVDIFE